MSNKTSQTKSTIYLERKSGREFLLGAASTEEALTHAREYEADPQVICTVVTEYDEEGNEKTIRQWER